MANDASCLVVTRQIKELATKLQGETEESTKNLVALWQKDNNKSNEEYPTAKELNEFRYKLRNPEAAAEESSKMLDEALAFSENIVTNVPELEKLAKVDLDFDPKTRMDRVNLIARLFSVEVSNLLKEIEGSLIQSINNTQDANKRRMLQEQLETLDKISIMENKTPGNIFKRVLGIFKDYVDDTEENRIQAELYKINSSKGADKYSEEQKMEAAKKRAEYKRREYTKIIDNFETLAEESSSILVYTEGIRISPSYMAVTKMSFNEEDEEGNSASDDQSSDHLKEESSKDGWMTNFRLASSQESLSQIVRKAIGTIPMLNSQGKYEMDDLGFQKYLDPNYVHAVLIDKLRDMVTVDDMIPLLESLVKNKPWVKQIIKLLEKNEVLYSQFYQDFRKDFTNYWIQVRVVNADGTVKFKTVSINTPEGIEYLITEWRNTYEEGTQLDEDSVYELNGDINMENAETGLKIVESLTKDFQNLDTDARLELLDDMYVWQNITKVLRMVGINVDPVILKNALTNIRKIKGVKITDPILNLLPQLHIIFKGIIKGDIKTGTDENGNEIKGDLINTFGTAYTTIARMVANVTDDAIESSVRENGKSYYSHTTPNYLGKLIKQLKNVSGDPQKFEEFINNEFKKYEWFYKDGEWRNDWLRQLVESKEVREGLRHKILLNSGKMEMQDWDDLDYTLVLLNEYWGEPDSKSDMKWAWYYVPLLSDASSAEFIRFRKYMNGSERDENGNKITYEDIILEKMVDLVSQEYDRIMLVRARDQDYQKKGSNIEPIMNYDIIRDSNGEIKNIGGAEFKFLPALNSLRYENGELFIDRLGRLAKESSGDELKTFIKQALKKVMDQGFEDAYAEWNKVGLFEEASNGKYKYIPFEGHSKSNERITKILLKAKGSIDSSLWTADMESILSAYSNNDVVINKEMATRVFNQIKDLAKQYYNKKIISKADYASISRLSFSTNAREALREYYWNSTFATSQIIELTTTDYAFYKNLEDFQKRYKEVHAPSLRLNTKATYKGERVGREWEKTIYLKDEEIQSSVLEDIKNILDERVKSGKMSKMDRDNIIYKFKNVNVADAQAYRSMSSFRSVMIMSGQWNEKMEKAFENFKNENWDISDFNVIWQIKKPYVYTQIENESGIDNHTGIKTPVQHKNSEFPLLAMYSIIAGNLSKSNRLKAIHEFMEENNIDVVQFESTTKVGKQGLIDLSDLNDVEQIREKLRKDTGISEGQENPNIVHKVSYEDYGIQVATPEHAIDAVQLIGTQLRKLITADISPDAIIEINGRKMTKKEWLDLYNAVNTENILQAFRAINEVFKDPKKVEEVLLSEVKGNPRYGVEMVKACTLNKNGQFNIPLYDPVQSMRVQALINSIIKKRITKQKIKGGALIQVSDYGLTEELNIVFKNKNGELFSKKDYFKRNPETTDEDYEEFIKKSREEGSLSIAYFECYMPAYSKDFYEPLMKSGTHELDIEKLPEDLRRLVGYRIPTEDKYSMAPLRIKGFLPQVNGSAIMLPAEITTISGSDFDKLISMSK